MTPVVILVRNNRAITEGAIASIRAQTMPVRITAINNGSIDGAGQMLNSMVDDDLEVQHFYPGKGVAASWNLALSRLFPSNDAVLIVNNDVLLRPDALAVLLASGEGFVTCVGVRGRFYGESRDGCKVFRDDDGKEIFPGHLSFPPGKRPHPDFSCFLIRRSVWEAVGPFDEEFRGAYAEDADYHVRMHKAGINACCIDVPFYHYGAGTLASATEEEATIIRAWADSNRAYFTRKWGCEVGSTAYYHDLFGHDAPSDTPRL